MMKLEFGDIVVDIDVIDEGIENVGLDVSVVDTGTGMHWRGDIYDGDIPRVVKDDAVRHLWVCDCGDCKAEECKDVYISPDFYEVNGNPVCVCGYGMTYKHTELIG